MATIADLIACVFATGKQVDDIKTKADALRVLGFGGEEHRFCTHKKMLQLVLRDRLENGDIDGKTIKELTSEVWRLAQLTETKERIQEISEDIVRKTRLENLDKAKTKAAASAEAALAAAADADALVSAPVEAEDVPVPASPAIPAVPAVPVSMPLKDLVACVVAVGLSVDDSVRTKADILRVLGFDDDEHYTHKQILRDVLRDHMADGDIAGMTIKEMTAEVWRIAELVETKERIEEISKALSRRSKLASLDKARNAARSPSPN